MAFTGGGSEVVESVELGGVECYSVCGCVLLDSGDAAGAGDGCDVIAAGQEPGQRGLGRGGADFGADGADFVDDGEVPGEVRSGEPRVGLAPVVVGEVVDRANLAGEQSVAER